MHRREAKFAKVDILDIAEVRVVEDEEGTGGGGGIDEEDRNVEGRELGDSIKDGKYIFLLV